VASRFTLFFGQRIIHDIINGNRVFIQMIFVLKDQCHQVPLLLMQARVEELIGVDLNNYAIATAEDCSQRLKNYVNLDVLDAIQRSASKAWVSETSYAKDSCLPDFSVLVINARKLEKDFVEIVLWWSKALNLRERFQILLYFRFPFYIYESDMVPVHLLSLIFWAMCCFTSRNLNV